MTEMGGKVSSGYSDAPLHDQQEFLTISAQDATQLEEAQSCRPLCLWPLTPLLPQAATRAT